jgi:hypothetical protein
MLNLGTHNVASPRLLTVWGETEDHHVIAFRRSARKDNFIALGFDHRGYLFAGTLDRLFGTRAVIMSPTA